MSAEKYRNINYSHKHLFSCAGAWGTLLQKETHRHTNSNCLAVELTLHTGARPCKGKRGSHICLFIYIHFPAVKPKEEGCEEQFLWIVGILLDLQAFSRYTQITNIHWAAVIRLPHAGLSAQRSVVWNKTTASCPNGPTWHRLWPCGVLFTGGQEGRAGCWVTNRTIHW